MAKLYLRVMLMISVINDIGNHRRAHAPLNSAIGIIITISLLVTRCEMRLLAPDDEIVLRECQRGTPLAAYAWPVKS